MAAKRDSWKTEPFKNTVPIPYSEEFSIWEFGKVARGLVPQAMEDKWFVFYEAPYLYLHRSWTGLPIYRVRFQKQAARMVVETAEVTDGEGYRRGDADYEARLLEFLIGNLLLGRSLPFPLRPEDEGDPIGIIQHSVSGTGYKNSDST